MIYDFENQNHYFRTFGVNCSYTAVDREACHGQ